MQSHSYNFSAGELIKCIGIPLVPLLLFAVVMHLGIGTFPAPRPMLDVDHTIIIHQVEAARTAQSTSILLLGDSSCLMDISANKLSAQTGSSVLDLGTLSYLDLAAYGRLLETYLRNHPSAPVKLVLLMHPEALRRSGPEPLHLQIFQSALEETDYCDPSSSRIFCLCGVNVFNGRFAAKLLPRPLTGGFAREYGFTRDLDAFMTRSHGSLLDPDPRPFQGNAEYRLSEPLEAESHQFRKLVPSRTQFFAGITPVPQTFAGKNHAERYRVMLRQWSEWMGARELKLPPTLPDELFAKTTHLNQKGVGRLTDLLAVELK